MHFHYRVTFTGYIRCFCATTSHGLVTLTFDLLTLTVFRVQCFSCPTNIPIYIILRLSVTELRVLKIWSHFRYLKQSLCMRCVTWPLTGGKIAHIFEIPDPNLPIHFVTFTALRRRLSHVIGKKIAFFPLWRLQSLLRMRNITWHVHKRSPKTSRNNFFYFELPIHYTTFMRLRWLLRVVYIWASPC